VETWRKTGWCTAGKPVETYLETSSRTARNLLETFWRSAWKAAVTLRLFRNPLKPCWKTLLENCSSVSNTASTTGGFDNWFNNWFNN
jgi:hypothetical protein